MDILTDNQPKKLVNRIKIDSTSADNTYKNIEQHNTILLNGVL